MKENIKIYMVGDSTVSKFNDYTYYYPRYGYGTQMQFFFHDADVVNLALSGRSSKSFIKEKNYDILVNSIKKGDYLFIGFGHNDEKYDDETRFTDASLDVNNPTSFKYYLYNYYIKVALAAGATPILCTPVVRISPTEEYTENNIHDTKFGNYQDAIISLAKSLGLFYVDLTTYTKEEALKQGYNKIAYQHAMTAGILKNGDLEADIKSVDKTHLNMLGARVVAYYIAREVKNSNLALKEYVNEEILYPEFSLLEMNKDYLLPIYIVPKIEEYTPNDNFDAKSNEWFGTAFGSLDELPTASSSYMAKKSQNGYLVGQYGNKLCGGMVMSGDGFAGVFRQIPVIYNFKIHAKATIKQLNYSAKSGFGLMLRDDMYLNQDEKKKVVASNYVCAGTITDDNGFSINYKRECQTEIVRCDNTVRHVYNEGDQFELELERLGQRITVKVIYEGKTYFNEFLDFDLVAIDSDYMYLGMFSTRGTVVEYSDVEYVVTGVSQGA